MDNGKIVWAPHPEHGFIVGKIADIGHDTITVQPFAQGEKPITSSYRQVFPSESDNNKGMYDSCALMYLNEATLLHNLRVRYKKNNVYTYVANILIAVNPYKELKDMYDAKSIVSYHGKSLGVRPPHCYAIADKAYRDMKVNKLSQSMIVSGESGAGKTENTKFVLKYLADSYGSGEDIDRKIVQANPLLEAFGNAKTVRNNNSSRFGKFVEIHFNEKSKVVGGFVSYHLLEKSRIVVQNSKERNYHIFYRLCCGAPDDLKEELYLKTPDMFKYMSSGCTQYFLDKDSKLKLDSSRASSEHRMKGPLSDQLLDDFKDFSRMKNSMRDIGLSNSEMSRLFRVVAGVLHLGNIVFEDGGGSSGGCVTSVQCGGSITVTAKLLGLDSQSLIEALTTRSMSLAGESDSIKVPLKENQAASAREALAKATYSHLFDHVVKRINDGLVYDSSQCYIGVLDIAGLEYFAINSFEQFCINYCNEKLQQFFNMRVLQDEQELYAKEHLGVHEVNYVDNQDCIDLFESPKVGILDLLDEESKLPRPSDSHFTSAVHVKHKAHFRISIPRKSQLMKHRNLRDDEGFLIRHFAGAVCYQTVQFVEKNNDALHHSLESLMTNSKDEFVRLLFGSGNMHSKKGKLSFVSVGNKFKIQLAQLLDKLNSTGSSFIRCIKPNLQMKSDLFDGPQILSQLQSAGMVSVLDLMKGGFPSRAQFSDLYKMYARFMPDHLKRLSPRLFCKNLFKASGLSEVDYKFGKTRIFFRPGKFAQFDELMHSDPEYLRQRVQKVKKWSIAARWRKVQWCALSVVKLKNKLAWRLQQYVLIQKTARGMIARRKHSPRIQALRMAHPLVTQIIKMRRMAEELKAGKPKMTAEIDGHDCHVTEHMKSIKISVIQHTVMEARLKTLRKQTEIIHFLIRKEQIVEAEEAERASKLIKAMEREARQREQEERRRQEEERLREEDRIAEDRFRQLKLEIEKKRKKEEEERNKGIKEERRLQERITAQLEKERQEEVKKQAILEQEKKDRELSMRIAQAEGQQVVEQTPRYLQRTDLSSNQENDMSKWTYAKLRNTLNTSTEISLLEASREEFHRRLKVYHSWKAKNTPRNKKEEQRAPEGVMHNNLNQAVSNQSQNAARPAQKEMRFQRYFRIPFIQPVDQHTDLSIAKRGWWYAHFDGRYIARQMELHPDKVPLLLVAGKDDMTMCELSLEETGLSRKKGAEILQHEFEQVWIANSGREYLLKAIQAKQARPTYATAMLQAAARPMIAK